MSTETVSDRYTNLDLWDDRQILDAMLEGQMAAVAAVRAALPAMAHAADAAVDRLRHGGRLVYAGAGTSGRLGVLDGVELTPTFNWPDDRLAFILAGGEASITRSVEGAEDDPDAARSDVERAAVGPRDVVIGLAASGTTVYTIEALRAARNRGALTIGIANNAGTPLLDAAEHAVLLDTGAEVIAGSTRMKAGTAQKIALNLLSSLLMIRLGRVYGGQMVDVRATNKKLVRRAERMLVAMTGRTETEARAALEACQGRVKQAVLVLHGLDPKQADAALETAGGNLRQALDATP